VNPNAERALQAVEADVLVTADPFTVGWLTGFAADATSGPSAFAVPPIAVVTGDGVTILCSSDEAGAVDPARARTVPYEGFTTAPLDPAAGQLAALAGLRLPGPPARRGSPGAIELIRPRQAIRVCVHRAAHARLPAPAPAPSR